MKAAWVLLAILVTFFVLCAIGQVFLHICEDDSDVEEEDPTPPGEPTTR